MNRQMRLCCIAGVLFLMMALMSNASAQESKASEAPATKFEAFSARKGTLLIKEFYDIGTLEGNYGTRAYVKAVVLYAPDESKIAAVRFERPTTSKYGSDQVGVIDSEELTSMIDALGYMIKLAASMQGKKVEYTEVVFTTRGGVSVGFYQNGTEQNAHFRVNSYSSDAYVFGPMNLLSTLKNLLEQSVNKLDAVTAQ